MKYLDGAVGEVGGWMRGWDIVSTRPPEPVDTVSIPGCFLLNQATGMIPMLGRVMAMALLFARD